MQIYIAAKYARRVELRTLVAAIEVLGHTVTSRWITEDGEEGKTIDQAAMMDVEDVLRAECIVFIGEPQASENRGGGRWFEFGLAYGLEKHCIAVLNMDPTRGGHDHLPPGHESVFTALPTVKIVTTQEELLEYLT